jgi:hypothetical protein
MIPPATIPHDLAKEHSMTRFRNVLAAAGLLALCAATLPALAEGGKQLKGVIEKVDLAANRMVVRETHGLKHEMPLNLAPDTKVVTPSGEASLAALHVGDGVTVSAGPGPNGETAREIQVTAPVEAAR